MTNAKHQSDFKLRMKRMGIVKVSFYLPKRYKEMVLRIAKRLVKKQIEHYKELEQIE